MASPQTEEGYTKIANELLEALAKIRIPGEARQVLDVIIRKTYGFNKSADLISLSQFVFFTGLKRPNVVRAIKKLLEMNVINRNYREYQKRYPGIKSDTPVSETIPVTGGSYGLNKDYEKWVGGIKSDTPVSKAIMTPVSKAIHTKETITKEIIDSNAISEKPKRKKARDDVDSEFIEKLKQLYPAINIDTEKRKAEAWLLCNPGRVMTRRFFNNWLSRARPEQTPANIENEIERLYGGKA